MWRNWNPCALLEGMQNGAATMQNGMAAPQNYTRLPHDLLLGI